MIMVVVMVTVLRSHREGENSSEAYLQAPPYESSHRHTSRSSNLSVPAPHMAAQALPTARVGLRHAAPVGADSSPTFLGESDGKPSSNLTAPTSFCLVVFVAVVFCFVFFFPSPNRLARCVSPSLAGKISFARSSAGNGGPRRDGRRVSRGGRVGHCVPYRATGGEIPVGRNCVFRMVSAPEGSPPSRSQTVPLAA